MSEIASNEFKVKFDGQLHQVNVNTLISSLVNISTILQETNNELNPSTKVDIKIKALKQGSFEVHWIYDFATAVAVTAPLLPGAISTTSDLLTILISFLDIKKHLQGEKPKAINQVDDQSIEIENNSGKIILVNNPTYNLYTSNNKIQDAISSTFSVLQEDPTIEDFEILDVDDSQLYEIKKDEFHGMSVKEAVIEEGSRVIIEIANLHIFKLVFDPKYKWEFYYKGNKISAYITDEGFFKGVDKGEEFAKGDILTVELKIEQVFDETVNTYVNRNYEVQVVKDHIPRAKQQSLDLDW